MLTNPNLELVVVDLLCEVQDCLGLLELGPKEIVCTGELRKIVD